MKNDFNVEKQTFYHHFIIIRTASIYLGGIYLTLCLPPAPPR